MSDSGLSEREKFELEYRRGYHQGVARTVSLFLGRITDKALREDLLKFEQEIEDWREKRPVRAAEPPP